MCNDEMEKEPSFVVNEGLGDSSRAKRQACLRGFLSGLGSACAEVSIHLRHGVVTTHSLSGRRSAKTRGLQGGVSCRDAGNDSVKKNSLGNRIFFQLRVLLFFSQQTPPS